MDLPRDINDILVEIGIACAIETALMGVFSLVRPKDACGMDDSPRWSWECSFIFQAFIFPLLCYNSWVDDGKAPFEEWLVEMWPNGELHSTTRYGCRIFMATFIGYLAKDFVLDQGLMYVVHHIVSAAICLFFLLGDLPPAFFVMGSTLAEVGSLAMNIDAMRWFGKYNWPQIAAIIMTFSNVGTVYLIYPLIRDASTRTPARMTVSVATFILCAARQFFAKDVWLKDGLKEVKEYELRREKKL